MRSFAVALVVLSVGCYTVHERPGGPGPDPGRGPEAGPGPGPGPTDAGFYADGAPIPVPVPVDGGPIVVPVPDGGDLLDACTRTCRHFQECDSSLPLLECIDGCIGARDLMRTPMCDALVYEALECLTTLDCDWLRSGMPEETPCGPLLREVEESCSTSGGGGGGGRPGGP